MPSVIIVDNLGEPVKALVVSNPASIAANTKPGQKAITTPAPAGLAYWDFRSSSWKLRPAAPSGTAVWDPETKTWG